MSEKDGSDAKVDAEKGSDQAIDSPLRRRNESKLTHLLKWAAWDWLYNVAECRAIGFEVRLEGPFGRIVDVVGIGKQNLVYIIEVKSSRNDLRRDDHTAYDQQRIITERAALRDAADLTSKILEDARRHAVNDSDGDEAWTEAPAYKQAHRDHDEAVSKLEAKKRRIETYSTKFHDPAFLACGDYHYLMTPKGLIANSELPPFWGLLDESATTIVEAVPKQVRRNTVGVLRAIAKANTRDLMKVSGISLRRTGSDEGD